MEMEQKEQVKKLNAAYQTIGTLQQNITERENYIIELENENRKAKEAANVINDVHNECRIKFEMEKIDIFNQHQDEVKVWRQSFEVVSRKHTDLEKKVTFLSSEDLIIQNLQDVSSTYPTFSTSPRVETAQIGLISNTFCCNCGNSIENLQQEYFCGVKINPSICNSCEKMCKDIASTDTDCFSTFPSYG